MRFLVRCLPNKEGLGAQGPGAHMGPGPYGPWPILGPYGPWPIWALAHMGPSLIFSISDLCFGMCVDDFLTVYDDFLNARKMHNVRTIILAAVSRRDLCYVSENEGFRFADT